MSIFRKTEHQVYFLYGSNMNPRQIAARCARAERMGVGCLEGARLAFFGHASLWDSGEETLVESPGHAVWGVLYRLSIAEADRLDACQGVRADGCGPYFLSPAEVTAEKSKASHALVFRKDFCGEPTSPSCALLDFIVEGARAQGLQSAYLLELQGIRSHTARYPVPRGSLGERRYLRSCDGCCP